jgi:hypothetical protein
MKESSSHHWYAARCYCHEANNILQGILQLTTELKKEPSVCAATTVTINMNSKRIKVLLVAMTEYDINVMHYWNVRS